MPDIEGPYIVTEALDLTILPAQLAEAHARGDGLAADLATCVRLRDRALAEVERLRPLARAAQALAASCGAEGAYIADKASEQGWVKTERAIRALWAAAEQADDD